MDHVVSNFQLFYSIGMGTLQMQDETGAFHCNHFDHNGASQKRMRSHNIYMASNCQSTADVFPKIAPKIPEVPFINPNKNGKKL